MSDTPAPQVETRTEWRNVYRALDSRGLPYSSREEANRNERCDGTRIAVEEITITTTTRRHPVAAPEDV